MDQTILGLDISTHMGWAVVSRDGIIDTGTVHMPPKKYDYRIARWSDYALHAVNIAAHYNAKFAVVEGYIHQGKFVNNSLFELGAIVRFRLWSSGLPIVECSPTALKLFVAGAGRATKRQMVEAVKELWGFDTKDDNQADAVGLACMGRVLDGETGVVPIERVEVVARLGKFMK